MSKLLTLVLVVSLASRALLGRWPWDVWRQWSALPPKEPPKTAQKVEQACRLLGVDRQADRVTILAAHKRMIAAVHPDRGGDARLVHEANEARDLLLAQLPAAR